MEADAKGGIERGSEQAHEAGSWGQSKDLSAVFIAQSGSGAIEPCRGGIRPPGSSSRPVPHESSSLRNRWISRLGFPSPGPLPLSDWTTLTLEDGTQVDGNVGGEALRFEQGSGRIIPGLDKELTGMRVGEAKQVAR